MMPDPACRLRGRALIRLPRTINSWGTSAFADTFKIEVQEIDAIKLPLQQAMTQSSYMMDCGINVVLLNASETENMLHIKAGIFYSGVIAGSCCADDPSPLDSQSEYCELQFDINTATAETIVSLL